MKPRMENSEDSGLSEVLIMFFLILRGLPLAFFLNILDFFFPFTIMEVEMDY